jgi:hypothetical protein
MWPHPGTPWFVPQWRGSPAQRTLFGHIGILRIFQPIERPAAFDAKGMATFTKDPLDVPLGFIQTHRTCINNGVDLHVGGHPNHVAAQARAPPTPHKLRGEPDMAAQFSVWAQDAKAQRAIVGSRVVDAIPRVGVSAIALARGCNCHELRAFGFILHLRVYFVEMQSNLQP